MEQEQLTHISISDEAQAHFLRLLEQQEEGTKTSQEFGQDYLLQVQN